MKLKKKNLLLQKHTIFLQLPNDERNNFKLPRTEKIRFQCKKKDDRFKRIQA